MAEIRIAVLGPHPPIVGDGIFDAAARGPAGARVREGRIGSRNASEEARRIDKGGVEAGEGDAAGAIDQGAVEGDADAAADRALDIALRAVAVMLPGVSPTTSFTGTARVWLRLVPSTEPSMPNTSHWLYWRL